jgi:hypothetical protein
MMMYPKDTIRFLSRIEVAESGCWEWSGRLRDGYGIFSLAGHSVSAHRVMYELVRDLKIPKDDEADHLCKNRRCVNPDHIEIVSGKENTLRGMGPTAINARKTHCVNGHELTPDNTYIRPDDQARDCKICAREAKRRQRERQKEGDRK